MQNKLAVSLIALGFISACGSGGKEVGEFKNDWTGNEIKVLQLSDPKIAGVMCHLTYFDRGFWDRVGKGNWFENPSNSSISCLQSGPVEIGKINLSKAGEKVFDQDQSLIFKQLSVRRIYDADTDSLLYVSYSRKIIDGSAKMSLSTVPLYNTDVAWVGRERPVPD